MLYINWIYIQLAINQDKVKKATIFEEITGLLGFLTSMLCLQDLNNQLGYWVSTAWPGYSPYA